MKTQEIRETFLDYFESKDHKVVKSSPLLPQDDPTLLFTNAGMNQFKNVFLGLEKRSYSRAASVQKCMRVSGKHNDLETVGKTHKHHTFFEMLGNFSFGDYFKQEAIQFAWELMTEVYKLPENRLYATVYVDDDDAFAIWQREIGLPDSRIFRMGKEDNYWSMGETGPCGPCSELHIDLGEKFEAGAPEDLIRSGSERFVELWNLVFMQFNQGKDGRIDPLPSPSVDTGMGLERMSAVLQRKLSNFETDVFQPITEAVAALAGREFPSRDDSDISVRIIADHIRAVSFLIGDGIMPANEGRGYVLRRLLRRAFRAGNALGLEEPFLYTLVGVVCDIMKDAYPELLASADYIANLCLSEEKRFALTLTSGLKVFQQYVDETKAQKRSEISGEHIFKLYDTFGFPLDLSRELAEEAAMTVDEPGFLEELQQQKERARMSWKGEDKHQEIQAYEPLKQLEVRFVGYDQERLSDAAVLALMKNGKQVKSLQAGEEGEVFLQATPFYAEAGGQIGDSGILKSTHFSALVETAYYPIPDIISHRVKVLSGSIDIGSAVEAEVDATRRRDIRKNHTATHLLHAALRQILGDHVKQAGSLVSPTRLRFDFTHFSALSPTELEQLEALINEKIQEAYPVNTVVTSMEEGVAAGAVAIFEEKYKEQVRMVVIDEFSKELCGGVHVHNTGEIGLFKIVSEGSVAAGMRRLEAVTGQVALKYVQENAELVREVQDSLNTTQAELMSQLDKLKKGLKDSEKEIKSLRQRLANQDSRVQEEKIEKVGDISVIVKQVADVGMSELRNLADTLKQKLGSGIVVLGAVNQDKVLLVAAVSKDLTGQLPAQELIKRLAPLVGGGGGGRPDFAQAGGTRAGDLPGALRASLGIIVEMKEKA
jgi:alanyl-tRNA synthetase